MLKAAVHTLGRRYVSEVLERSYATQKPDERGPNERPLEYSFALSALSLTEYQDALDVGTGQSPWPALLAGCGYHVTAIDEMGGYWKGNFHNRHFAVHNHDITKSSPGKFGIVTCLSTLEHIPGHKDAVRNMLTSLKPGGILIMTFPYNEQHYIPNAYALPTAGYGKDNPYITQIYDRKTLESWGGEIMRQTYYRCFTGQFWTEGKRLRPMVETTVEEPHHLTGVVLRDLGLPTVVRRRPSP
jgi:SAM-dependent methyltransferase